MSRRPSDSLKANQYNLLVDWSDYSPFHRNRCGYRLIATIIGVGAFTSLMR
jgi:hypothetical protein